MPALKDLSLFSSWLKMQITSFIKIVPQTCSSQTIVQGTPGWVNSQVLWDILNFEKKKNIHYMSDARWTRSFWLLISIWNQGILLWVTLALQSWASVVTVIKYKKCTKINVDQERFQGLEGRATAQNVKNGLLNNVGFGVLIYHIVEINL